MKTVWVTWLLLAIERDNNRIPKCEENLYLEDVATSNAFSPSANSTVPCMHLTKCFVIYFGNYGLWSFQGARVGCQCLFDDKQNPMHLPKAILYISLCIYQCAMCVYCMYHICKYVCHFQAAHIRICSEPSLDLPPVECLDESWFQGFTHIYSQGT